MFAFGLAPTTDVPAAAVTRPNVIVFVTDDQTWYTIPSILSVDPMPYLNGRILDPNDHWIRFTNAFLNTPICCPTRASLFTGRYSHHTGVETNGGGLADVTSTTATWLRSAGYHTGLIGKYINRYPFGRRYTIPPGWVRWAANYDQYYNSKAFVDGRLTSYGATPADYSTDVIARKAVEFIETAPAGTPFYLHVSPKAMHDPYTPAPRHDGAFRSMPPVRFPNFNETDVSDKPAWVRGRAKLGRDAIAVQDQRRIDAFETLLAADEAIRDIFTALERRGVLDETVFIFLSDNGFAFGEHRWNTKKCGYDVCTRTPLLVRYPGATSHSDARLVSSVDIAPTLAELAGVTPATPVDGMSIVPLLSGASVPWRTEVLLHAVDDAYGTPGYWAAHTGDTLYVELSTGERELYDMGGVIGPPDPWQLQNRARDPAYASLRATLTARLLALRGGPVSRVVHVTDGIPDPAVTTDVQSVHVTWEFEGTSSARCRDTTGLATFDTGDRPPGTSSSKRFDLAGSYSYACETHLGTATGSVNVPVRVGPPSGGPTSIYLVTWGDLRPTPGYVVDVQIERPAGPGFVDWKIGTKVASAVMIPDGGKGLYRFRARLRSLASGAVSGWSPEASLVVS